MKKSFRFISAVLCVVMIASLFASVSAFADEGKPGPDDLKDAGKYVYGPKNDESWLDEYKEAYVYASYGVAAYTYCTSTCAAKSKTIEHGTKVSVLAEEYKRSLIKTEEGTAFWVDSVCLADHYVAPGRAVTDNAEVDANGPCLNDIKGIDKEMDRPSPKDWLDEAVESYVYAPKYHYGTDMFYYFGDPTSQKAIDNGYDRYRSFGKVYQGTPITLLAHHGNLYLAKNESGACFWIYDWCVSETQVAYGEAK